ncbi:MAG: hypothetical protein KGV44_12825 [Flavobacteriaceae bacterium]|nr:hypothetical protein [Flavobacteriaceae bacterium]
MKDLLKKSKDFFNKEYKELPYWAIALVASIGVGVYLYSQVIKKYK